MVKYKLVDTLLYQSEEGAVEGKFIISDETLWASRKVVAEIFATTGPNISMHFENIVREGELEEIKLPRLVEAVDFLDCFLGIH